MVVVYAAGWLAWHPAGSWSRVLCLKGSPLLGRSQGWKTRKQRCKGEGRRGMRRGACISGLRQLWFAGIKTSFSQPVF